MEQIIIIPFQFNIEMELFFYGSIILVLENKTYAKSYFVIDGTSQVNSYLSLFKKLNN